MTTNNATWLMEAKAIPFTIKVTPLTSPGLDQILIKNHAIAINPIDGKLQYFAVYPLTYPTILDQDVASEVISVGPGVTRSKPRDRVLGVTTGFVTGKNAEKGSQSYTIPTANGTSQIRDHVSFENAVVLPLALSTAASGLFYPNILNLRLPTEPALHPMGKTLLVWGGASSVGSNAIQLAVASGYEVITTASPKNFDYMKGLGAGQVFDYDSPSIVSDLVDTSKGKNSVGIYDAVGEATWHVGKAVFEYFLPKALKSGAYVLAPEPIIAGTGLESIQFGIDMLRKGVSAKKVVVLL
ncbi:zinc-binding oxidoreductase CipB [Leptodontidium sp. 2 PMI_412]|nr:zinc-binding oxidoreductase CipB [Leptodontidium sp. 2 PMI_412]